MDTPSSRRSRSAKSTKGESTPTTDYHRRSQHALGPREGDPGAHSIAALPQISGGELKVVVVARVEKHDPISDDRRGRAVNPRSGEYENPGDQRTNRTGFVRRTPTGCTLAPIVADLLGDGVHVSFDGFVLGVHQLPPGLLM